MKLFLLSLALITTAVNAQSTWKSLHFGESRNDVRDQLAQQGISVEISQEGTLQSTADYELLLPGLRNPLYMQASFHFLAAGVLADVTLTLDVPAMHRYYGYLGSDDILMGFAADKLGSSLSGRYGAPLFRSPACDPADGKQPANFCTTTWRGNEQVIELERLSTPRGNHLVIRYQPLATDL